MTDTARTCSTCGQPMVTVMSGQDGLYFTCMPCAHRANLARQQAKALQRRVDTAREQAHNRGTVTAVFGVLTSFGLVAGSWVTVGLVGLIALGCGVSWIRTSRLARRLEHEQTYLITAGDPDGI